MKDIPFFTSPNGIAALTLREIPYTGRAYVKILDSLKPEALLAECHSFCRACGAELILASGDPALEKYPVHATLIRMCRRREGMESRGAMLFPVTAETARKWRQIYNERMADIPNAAYMTSAEEKKLLEKNDAYFVHRGGELLGIGRASGETIDAVAAVQPGAGADVVLALAELLTGDAAYLTVAKENTRAVKLYERMGFTAVGETSKWFRIVTQDE